jgi:hypothetical protein
VLTVKGGLEAIVPHSIRELVVRVHLCFFLTKLASLSSRTQESSWRKTKIKCRGREEGSNRRGVGL